ncbi:MAG: glycosyltransferase family 39 protein [Patescibacteria group bacterium]
MDNLKKHWVDLALLAIILGSALLMFFSARTDSITVDEKVHISAGYLHVFEGDYSFNTEHPPLLNDLEGLLAKIARPKLPKTPIENYQPYGSGQWNYAADFWYHSGNNVEQITAWARLPIILLTLGLIYLVFLWAKTLFGPRAGLIAATLTAFCPNILAHGRLATTDMGLVFFFVLALWLFRKWLLHPTWRNIFWFSLALAGTILAKFSGLLILPIILAAAVIFIPKKSALRQIYQLMFSLVVVVILTWILYAFSMRANIVDAGLVKWLVMPFEKFWAGYQMVSNHNSVGHWSYFNGKMDYRGWWDYFPEVLALKLPLEVFVLLILAILFFRQTARKFFEEFLIIFPPLFFLGVAMTSRIDIGIRHILVILPFLFILIARLAVAKGKLISVVVTLLVAAQILVGILAYPNYITYFNPLAGGVVKASAHIADSNLDWDQNMIRFADYAKANNIKKVYELCWNYDAFGYYGLNAEILPNTPPSDGWVVICIQQIRVPPSGFDMSWATKYPPDRIIGGTMYVWDFTKKR